MIFTGRLDHNKEIKYYYADADVCVSIPSSDSSPFSVYEAMATKTPVIVSDLPWVSENFDKNEHNFIDLWRVFHRVRLDEYTVLKKYKIEGLPNSITLVYDKLP